MLEGAKDGSGRCDVIVDPRLLSPRPPALSSPETRRLPLVGPCQSSKLKGRTLRGKQGLASARALAPGVAMAHCFGCARASPRPPLLSPFPLLSVPDDRLPHPPPSSRPLSSSFVAGRHPVRFSFSRYRLVLACEAQAFLLFPLTSSCHPTRSSLSRSHPWSGLSC